MIYGKGIYLRKMLKEDIDIVYDLCVNDEVMKYDGGNISYVSKEYLKENFRYFEIKSKKDYTIINSKGTMVGAISYRKSYYVSDAYYISIAIGKQYWRNGYGEKSIKTLLRYLFINKKAHKVELEVVEVNDAAVQCYKKCGFIEEGRRRKKYLYKGRYVDTILMGILDEEFKEKE